MESYCKRNVWLDSFHQPDRSFTNDIFDNFLLCCMHYFQNYYYVNLIRLLQFICIQILKTGGDTCISNIWSQLCSYSYLKYLHTDSAFLDETLCLCYFNGNVISCPLNMYQNQSLQYIVIGPCIWLCPVDWIAFLSYVVKLLYTWPLESFTCKCVVQLLVSSLIKCLLFFFSFPF